ncbi:ABC-F family ATP-binding cassette domain-containing protein [Ancylobacter terrae]|uniref:ABC-F family ATP-binding cassette domain-containing protein n=1 Tax=Ancylobacter sp. sgz301288 TaxID=3342077 RepID=UPI003859114E
MSSIRLAGLTGLTPGGQPLFSGLHLVFGKERTGLIGRNGVGKSTLLKLIAGERTPAAGSVHVDGAVYLLRQTVSPPAGQTIADLFEVSDALAALRRAEAGRAGADELAEVDWLIEGRVREALARMGLQVSADTRLDRLSGGERTRAALAAAVFAAPDFLLLDEPTNNLDRAGRQAVVELLRGWRSGAIIVSHDRELLAHVDVIVEVSSLGATRYGGNWDMYRARKQRDAEAAQHALAEADRQVAQLRRKAQTALERQDRRDAAGARKGARGDLPRLLLGGRRERAEASRGDGKRLADRRQAEASDALAEARSKVEAFDKLRVALPATQLPASRQVLRLVSVTIGHEVGRPLIRSLSFSMVGPERVALVGPNGVGKTSLLKLIAGTLSSLAGSVELSVSMAMLDQNVALLDPDLTIRDNFMRLNAGASENACRAALAAFQFRADNALQQVGTLSGGQALRAGLACVLGGLHPPELLILDEPTNHLDLDSIEAVEAGLRAYDGALLVVSHDEHFLANIAIERRLELGTPRQST